MSMAKAAPPRGTYVLHIWQTFDSAWAPLGEPRVTVYTDKSISQVCEEVLSNLRKFSHPVTDQYSTRTLDGWLVAFEFKSAHYSMNDLGMRHWVRWDDEPWKAMELSKVEEDLIKRLVELKI